MPRTPQYENDDDILWAKALQLPMSVFQRMTQKEIEERFKTISLGLPSRKPKKVQYPIYLSNSPRRPLSRFRAGVAVPAVEHNYEDKELAEEDNDEDIDYGGEYGGNFDGGYAEVDWRNNSHNYHRINSFSQSYLDDTLFEDDFDYEEGKLVDGGVINVCSRTIFSTGNRAAIATGGQARDSSRLLAYRSTGRRRR